MAKFEESIKELEKIVKDLEDGEPSLDESLKSFEKGITLIKVCQKELESAENKIKELTEDGETKSFQKDSQ
tara:strand:- start:1589 stop:1801 length:213 start_codon:yes stop_codon:yes gene_type:complete